MKLRWMPLLLPVRLLLSVILLFMLWQAWVFLRPRPRVYTAPEVQAVAEACRLAAGRLLLTNAAPARFAVAHFRGDSGDLVTETLRGALAARPGWTVAAGSPINQFLKDVSRAVGEATSLDEILHAGRRVDLDVLVAGRVLSVTQTNQTGHAMIRVHAYDTRTGTWLLRDTIAAEWSPSLLESLALRIGGWRWRTRFLIWLLVVLALPWLTLFGTRWALARRSNLASALLLGGYTLAGLVLGVCLRLFTAAGGVSWPRFFLFFILCGAYNFWTCERIAGRE